MDLARFLGRNPMVGGEPFTRMNPGVAVSERSFLSLVFDPNGRPHRLCFLSRARSEGTGAVAQGRHGLRRRSSSGPRFHIDLS
jgi:hypothetical protein